MSLILYLCLTPYIAKVVRHLVLKNLWQLLISVLTSRILHISWSSITSLIHITILLSHNPMLTKSILLQIIYWMLSHVFSHFTLSNLLVAIDTGKHYVVVFTKLMCQHVVTHFTSLNLPVTHNAWYIQALITSPNYLSLLLSYIEASSTKIFILFFLFDLMWLLQSDTADFDMIIVKIDGILITTFHTRS